MQTLQLNKLPGDAFLKDIPVIWIRRGQFSGEGSNGLCNVGQNCPDPSRTTTVSMDNQPNPGAWDR
jgi:hypothetical protein